ncbi:YqaJ viral recombinase family protein [Dietzia aurantiaca]|uniref:YqaJ viral recombinase family nuclease n=1 Tax=Dietzia aurantiaca TaxID=983873 RepID=UPI001E3CA357|nr:YqaJ viral recombinase family protein [Dietzia aurantiaca]MCD2263264.1 YqaJ viral recombinase family protein [Dietzia aurantiaca]
MTATIQTGIPEAWRAHCAPVPEHKNGSAEWLLERRHGVGASEISTILGFNQYSSTVDLWEDKTGRRPVDTTPPSPQAVWGHRMEPYIRLDAEEETGWAIGTCGSVVSTEWPWLRYSPDGFFDDGGLFEAKTTGFFQRDEWADGQTADHAELQVQAGMAVTGAKYAIVAAVIDRGPLQLRKVERDDDVLIPLIVDRTREFWQHVIDDIQPPLDGSEATTRLLTDRYPDHNGDVVDDTGTAAEWAAKYRAASVAEKEAERAKREAANNLRELIGSATRLTAVDGDVVAGLRGGKVDEKRLVAEHPDLAAQYTTDMPVIDTARLKADHPDIYKAMQFTSIAVPKEK